MSLPTTVRGWVQLAAAIVGLFITLGSAAFAVDTHYDRKYATKKDITHIVGTVKELRCDVIEAKLDELLLKKEHNELREYEKIRLEQLKREWERVCNSA